MAKITEEQFVSIIESLRLQTRKDVEYASAMEDVLKIEGISCYDNSMLFKSIISLLQVHFPKTNNHCPIEHYCFELNFGKIGEEELITIEDLWHGLIKTPLTSTHPLIDDDSQDYALSNPLRISRNTHVQVKDNSDIHNAHLLSDETIFTVNMKASLNKK